VWYLNPVPLLLSRTVIFPFFSSIPVTIATCQYLFPSVVPVLSHIAMLHIVGVSEFLLLSFVDFLSSYLIQTHNALRKSLTGSPHRHCLIIPCVAILSAIDSIYAFIPPTNFP
jgi:hypothetical protein